LAQVASRDEIVTLANSLFDNYDVNNDGSIDRSELKTIITKLFKEVNDNTICSETRMNKLFSNLDKDSNGKLDKKEFRQVVAQFLNPNE
jgi:Ca2+-binding EF-hand superfamily protein